MWSNNFQWDNYFIPVGFPKGISMSIQLVAIYSWSIDKDLETYETDQAIEYLWNSLKYDSSQDAYFKMEAVELAFAATLLNEKQS